MLVIFRREQNPLDVSDFADLFRCTYTDKHLQDTYDTIDGHDERKLRFGLL